MTKAFDASGRFVLRMEPGLHAALRAAAKLAGLSLNDYCVRKLAAPGYAGQEPAGRVIARAAGLFGDGLVGIVAFGSWARGEATRDSDVDVLVVLGREVRLSRALYREWDASGLEWSSRRVDAHFVHLPAEPDGVTNLWAEVAVDGVVLFDRGFTLSRKLAAIRARIASGEIVRRRSNGQPYWAAA